MNVRSLWQFLVIIFGLSWSVFGLFALFPEQLTQWFGEVSIKNPLFIIAVYAPAIAAFVLVIRNSGLSGLRCYLSRLLLWRVHWTWYLMILVGIPLIYYAGSALKGNLFSEPFLFTSLTAFLPALFLMMIIGPVEEFGWRGVAMPLLQQRFAPIWAGLILGLIWGVWHLPAFFLSGTPQSSWSFLPFLIGSISVAVIVTPLFNASKGSILLPALFHWQLNNPAFPDAHPHDTIIFMSAAIIVVFLNRKTMFSKDGAVTEVIPSDKLYKNNLSMY